MADLSGMAQPGSQPASGGHGSGSVTGGFELVSSGMAGGAGLSPPCSTVGGLSITDVTLEQALSRMQELSRENSELRDYLKENNEMMKKQFETLSQWKQKVHDANVMNREKFEQTRAVITALRSENEELQRKVTDAQDKEVTLSGKIKSLEAELSSLQAAKAFSDQLAYNVVKQAEKQGVEVAEEETQMRETVYVASAEKEERIMQLEVEVAQKTEELEQMKERQARLEQDITQFRQHTEQLLKDAETTQALKQQIQSENQELRQENVKLRQEVQSMLAESKNSLQRNPKNMFSFGLHFPGPQQAKEGGGDAGLGLQEELDQSPERTADDWQAESAAVTEEVSQLRCLLEAERQMVAQQKDAFEASQQEIQQLKDQVMLMNAELENCQTRHEERVKQLQRQHEVHVEEIERQRTGDSSQQQQQVLEATYTEDIQTLRSQVLTLINEVHEIQSKLSAAQRTIEVKNGRIKELEGYSTQMVEESRRQVQQLQHTLANSERNLLLEQQNHAATKQQMNELRKSFNQLVSDYKEVLDTFDQYKVEQEQRNAAGSNQKQQMETINHLTAQVVAAEEAINVREERIRKLQTELKDKDETITVFQAQAEVYKSDFTAERDARARLATERDRLAGEIEAQQVRNQELTDQLTQYAQRQLADMQLRASGQHGPAQATYSGHYVDVRDNRQAHQPMSQTGPGSIQPSQHDEEEQQIFTCPSCERRLPDFDTLNIHVQDCLEQRAAEMAQN
ncbi:hypothetical protein BaRGS_00013185 [Batillaria attramentaria]|uniref:CCHC NOA-type domain-containing protein n=1 Tax=Batillaria attramentaria TaxID=370345 RepID=A0ABD0L804_9CAEN